MRAACPTPLLNLSSSSVPPGTTCTIRSPPGPCRIQQGQQNLTIAGQIILILTVGSEMTLNYFFFLVFVLDFMGQSTLRATMNPQKFSHLISQAYVTFLRIHYSQKVSDVSPFSSDNTLTMLHSRSAQHWGFWIVQRNTIVEQFSYNNIECGCVVNM